MDVLTQPLTIQELKERASENNYVEGVVELDLSEAIDNDLEGFLDLISEKLTGSPLLMDSSYSVVGARESGAILLKVSGDVSMVLESEDE